MQFITSYIALLSEAFEDITTVFESNTSRGFLVGTLVLIPIFGSFFFFAILVNAAEYIFPTPTVTIYTEQIDGNTIEVKVSGNEGLLNAAEVEILFDPTHLQVDTLVIEETICEDRFVITKEIDNATGRVFYQCGTISPLDYSSATIATLIVSPYKAGQSDITFGDTTNVLAHDGYGSNMTKERLTSVFVF